jgi:hypothetical protein
METLFAWEFEEFKGTDQAPRHPERFWSINVTSRIVAVMVRLRTMGRGG